MKIEVVAYPRTQQGTGASRRLRASGRVPGVIYGASQPAVPVELDHNALARHLKLEAFHASILDLSVEGARERVLLRDFQMHPWKQQVLHVDFQRVDPNRKIHMRVPLHFMNQEMSEGVKLGGGVLSHIMNDLDVQCLPDALPEYIEVDVGNLKVGETLHVQDLALPPGVELTSKLKADNPSVATIQVPRGTVAEDEAATPSTEITSQTGEAATSGEAEKK